MASEIPSLIREIQLVLRKEAGVPSYDPSDPTLPRFPTTLEEAISGLDPSTPSYLRCKKCQGKLLRGLQSTVCVYCGTEQRRDALPQTISFKSTVGYRKFLESLDLDGSEAVTLNTQSNDSAKGQDVSMNGLLLSDLLDLELSWPLEKEGTENSSKPIQSSYSLNLSGVDLDNFFSESKIEIASSAPSLSQESLSPMTHIINSKNNERSAPESIDLFENLRSSDMEVGSVGSIGTKISEFGGTFATWEGEFQSVGSETLAADSKSNNLFQDSSTVIFSSPLKTTVSFNRPTDTITKSISDVTNGEPPSDVGQLSSMDDHDLWHTASVGVSSTSEQSKISSEVDDGDMKFNSSIATPLNDNRVDEDLWPTRNSGGPSNAENIIRNDDSFDDWQDFTSSGHAPQTLSNSWTQTGIGVTKMNDQAFKTDSAHLIDNVQDMEFGNFTQSDFFAGVSGVEKHSGDVNSLLLEASVSDRMNEMEKTRTDFNTWVIEDNTNNVTTSSQLDCSKNSNVEHLLSQMNDLSFMLESELSIPTKNDESSDLNP